MKKPYHLVSREAKVASATLEEFAKAKGQILLRLVELITQARMAVDEAIDSIGRPTSIGLDRNRIRALCRGRVLVSARPRTRGSGDLRSS